MKWAIRVIGLLVIAVLVLLFVNPRGTEVGGRGSEVGGRGSGDPASVRDREGLNRAAKTLIYSKHARCRMGCRYISEDEVVDILRNGEINYQKSDMRGDRDPKYAVEGMTRDGQKVRIVFAQSPRGVVVVTVIDLKNEWRCDCK